MRLIESFKKRKLVLFNIFLTLYVGINLVGGERGLISYFDKKNTYANLNEEKEVNNSKINDFILKIKLIKNNDLDYLDIFTEKNLNLELKMNLLLN